MISFSCPSCGTRLQAPLTAAGKTGVCAKCKGSFTVPIQFEDDPPAPAPKPVTTTTAPRPTSASTPPAAAAPVSGPSRQLLLLAGGGVAVLFILGITVGVLLASHHAPPAPVATPAPTPLTVEERHPAPVAPAVPVAAPVAARVAPPVVAMPVPMRYPPQVAMPVDADQAKIANLQEQIRTLNEKRQVAYLQEQKERLQHEVDGTPAPPAHAPSAASVADVVADASPSVVTVQTNIGVGAAWVAFENQLLVTNYHVVHGSRTISLIFKLPQTGHGKRTATAPGTVIAVDVAHDLALIRMTGTIPNMPAPLTLAKSPPRAGDSVIAIGNPAIGTTILDQTVTTGIISNVERKVGSKTYLQTSAAINPGNSGGPLLTTSGEVVGVVTAKGTEVENIGFAVPASFVQQLYDKRETTYGIHGDLAFWEHDHELDALADQPGAIPVHSVVTDLTLLQPSMQLVALATDRNKVLVIDTVQGKVVSEIFAGTGPTQLLPSGRAGQVWVLCTTSRSFALVDVKNGRLVTTVHSTHEPVSFTIVRDRIWYVDSHGSLGTVGLNGTDEQTIDLNNVRSVAYNPNARTGDLLCGSANAWLVGLPSERLITVQGRIKRLTQDLDDLRARANRGDSAAWQRCMQLQVELQKLHDDLQACVKNIEQPGGSGQSPYQPQFQNYIQALFLDRPHKRLYFNRCAIDIDHQQDLLGVFQDPEHSLSRNTAVSEFLRRYPYYTQILAVSPDGKLAASGTHLFNAEDFTVVRELPVPTTAVAFSADSKILFLADPFNGQIDPLPLTTDPATAGQH